MDMWPVGVKAPAVSRGVVLKDIRLGNEVNNVKAKTLDTFVDKDRKTCDRIKRTAKSLGVASSEMSVICGDTVRLAESSQLFGAPFDVVILDPPYAVEVEVVSKLLKDLIQSESLTNDAVVVYEHSHKTDSVSLDDFELSKSKRYGIAHTLLRHHLSVFASD